MMVARMRQGKYWITMHRRIRAFMSSIMKRVVGQLTRGTVRWMWREANIFIFWIRTI